MKSTRYISFIGRSFKKWGLFTILIAGAINGYSGINTSRLKVPADTLSVNKLFTNNMVLQQGIPLTVWGTAAVGTTIVVAFNGKKNRTVTKANKSWIVKLPAMPYGGPYKLLITSAGKIIRIQNVMVGEVWLASGQSNMNFSIGRPVANLESVLADANYPMIREFSVPSTVSKTPLAEVIGGSWKICNAVNVKDFSAVAFFFAKQLWLKKKVAIGIIHTSFSGTPIESWLPAAISKPEPDNDDWFKMQTLSDSVAAVRNNIIETAADGIKEGVQLTNYDDKAWKLANYPVETNKLAPPYSFIWFRKNIEIPASAAGKDMILHLGKIKEADVTYFNGTEVGRSNIVDSTVYIIPGNLIKPGRNVVAVRLLSQWGNGSLGYPYDKPNLESRNGSVKISLMGQWTYNPDIEPQLPTRGGYANKPSSLYNGMINPLVPYGIKGFLWYQGEANARKYKEYSTQLPVLIRDWRERWRLGDIPFLVVQLPNYKLGIQWAWMRDAQATALNSLNTGMAVIIDSGDPYDVHPTHKDVVGYRLSLLALKLAYHHQIIATGPVYDNYKTDGSNIIISFKKDGGNLKSGNGMLPGFTIAGTDQHFYPAKAIIKNNQLSITAPQVKTPVAVRYAWEPDPKVSVYNTEGLPAAPFRTDNWDK